MIFHNVHVKRTKHIQILIYLFTFNCLYRRYSFQTHRKMLRSSLIFFSIYFLGGRGWGWGGGMVVMAQPYSNCNHGLNQPLPKYGHGRKAESDNNRGMTFPSYFVNFGYTILEKESPAYTSIHIIHELWGKNLSGSQNWHWGNHNFYKVSVKQSWKIWVNKTHIYQWEQSN